MSVREKNYEDVERSVLETIAWSKINGINPRFRVNIYISFFDRVYELNLLIYDNDDDDGTMISLNMRILVFFRDMIINTCHRDFKKIFTHDDA